MYSKMLLRAVTSLCNEARIGFGVDFECLDNG